MTYIGPQTGVRGDVGGVSTIWAPGAVTDSARTESTAIAKARRYSRPIEGWRAVTQRVSEGYAGLMTGSSGRDAVVGHKPFGESPHNLPVAVFENTGYYGGPRYRVAPVRMVDGNLQELKNVGMPDVGTKLEGGFDTDWRNTPGDWLAKEHPQGRIVAMVDRERIVRFPAGSSTGTVERMGLLQRHGVTPVRGAMGAAVAAGAAGAAYLYTELG